MHNIPSLTFEIISTLHKEPHITLDNFSTIFFNARLSHFEDAHTLVCETRKLIEKYGPKKELYVLTEPYNTILNECISSPTISVEESLRIIGKKLKSYLDEVERENAMLEFRLF